MLVYYTVILSSSFFTIFFKNKRYFCKYFLHELSKPKIVAQKASNMVVLTRVHTSHKTHKH